MKVYYIILKHGTRCIAEGILKIKNLMCYSGGVLSKNLVIVKLSILSSDVFGSVASNQRP